MIQRTRPILSRSAFWDIDLGTLDYDRYSDFTIVRVFERGTVEDITQVLDYYGRPLIIETLTRANSLMPRAIALGEKMLGISADQFACSKHLSRGISSMY